jgi:hypothetical protein
VPKGKTLDRLKQIVRQTEAILQEARGGLSPVFGTLVPGRKERNAGLDLWHAVFLSYRCLLWAMETGLVLSPYLGDLGQRPKYSQMSSSGIVGAGGQHASAYPAFRTGTRSDC